MCITSDHYQVWHTGNTQIEPFTWIVSALDPEYAHHSIFLKMIKIKSGLVKLYLTKFKLMFLSSEF